MERNEREEIINDIVGIYSDNLLHYKDGYEELEYKLRDKLETVSNEWLEKWYNDYMSNDTLSAKKFMYMLVQFLKENDLPLSLNNEIQETKLYTSINEFKKSLINEAKVSDKDWKRMVDLIQGKSDSAKVANLIGNKDKAINRFVAGLKLSGSKLNYNDVWEKYSGIFSEFGNKALKLGATVEEIQNVFNNTEIPTKYADMVSPDKMKGKEFNDRFVGFLSKAIVDAGYDIKFTYSGNALTMDGKDAMRRSGRKWTIGYKADITVGDETYHLQFDAITDEGDGPTYYNIYTNTSQTSKIFSDSYDILGKRDFLKFIMTALDNANN